MLDQELLSELDYTFLAEGYLEEDAREHIKLKDRLFVIIDQNLMIAKTNISSALNKNRIILLEDIQKIPAAYTFNEIYLVGECFNEIDQYSLEELKTKCYELWTLEEENFNKENILKTFTNKN